MHRLSASNNLGCAPAQGDAATALIDLGGETGVRRYTYRDVEQQCDALGRGLSRQGLRPGERVAIVAANRAQFLMAFLGTMRAGVVAVPINYQPAPAMVGYGPEDCGARAVICDGPRRALVPAGLRCFVVADGWHDLLDNGRVTAVEPAPIDPAMFLSASGSTGRPNDVVLSHRSHLWVLEMRSRAPPAPGRRTLVAAPLYHMNGLATCQSVLANAGTIVLLPAFTRDAACGVRDGAPHDVHARGGEGRREGAYPRSRGRRWRLLRAARKTGRCRGGCLRGIGGKA